MGFSRIFEVGPFKVMIRTLGKLGFFRMFQAGVLKTGLFMISKVGPLKTWIFYDFYGRAIENLDCSMIFKVGPFKMMGNHNFKWYYL